MTTLVSRVLSAIIYCCDQDLNKIQIRADFAWTDILNDFDSFMFIILHLYANPLRCEDSA